jgi:NAD(P)-dependent dehydrogenase (short-subunit alcohol dehydrogenase family)
MSLANRVALISGGARGMGAVEARLFAGVGAKIVIGDIRDVEGQQVEAQMSCAGAGWQPRPWGGLVGPKK